MAKKTLNSTTKTRPKPNGSILTFFKTENLFVQSDYLPSPPKAEQPALIDDLWEGSTSKRRKLSNDWKASNHEEPGDAVIERKAVSDATLGGGETDSMNRSQVING